MSFLCYLGPQLLFAGAWSCSLCYSQICIFCSYLQAEAKILKGPHEDLESYLQAIEQLRNNIKFFSNNKSFKSSDGVLNHTNTLLAKAISKLEEEFKQLLSSYRFVLLFLWLKHMSLMYYAFYLFETYFGLGTNQGVTDSYCDYGSLWLSHIRIPNLGERINM